MITRRTILAAGAATMVAPVVARAAMKPKLVITGDMGTVATRILSLGFLQKKYEIVGIDKKRGPQEEIAWPIPVAAWRYAEKFANAVACLHLAWIMDAHNNTAQIKSLDATKAVYELCRDYAVPVLAFSSSAYAAPGLYGNKTVTGDGAVNPYGFSKRLTEGWLKESIERVPGLSVGVWRLGRVTPKAIPDPDWDERIMMTDDDIIRAINYILEPAKQYRMIGPFELRGGK